MRTCCCTGYLTNPGGVCCMDLPARQAVTAPNTGTFIVRPVPKPEPLTEEDIRRIIREELARSKKGKR